MSKLIHRCWPLFAVSGLVFVGLAVAYSKLEWGVGGAMEMVLGGIFAFKKRAQEIDPTSAGPAS
jgi:hypothetical protein